VVSPGRLEARREGSGRRGQTARAEDVQREIDGLRMKRREVENDIESLVKTLNTTLEFIREQDARARDERVLLHRPRPQELPAAAPQQVMGPQAMPKAETGS
jgi:hypothetical protein